MIYVIQDVESNPPLYKVGYTDNVERRFKQLQSGNSRQLELIIHFEGTRETEKELHGKFKSKKKHVQGSREWFYLDYEDILFLKRYMHVCHLAHQESQEKNSKAKEDPFPSSSEAPPKTPPKGLLALILLVIKFVFK